MCPAHNEVFRVAQNSLSVCRPPALPFCKDIVAETFKNKAPNLTNSNHHKDSAPPAGSKHRLTIIRFGFFATGCKNAIANSKCVGQKTEARLSPIAQPSVLTFQSSVLGGALACQNPHAPDQSVFHSLRPIHNCPRATRYNSPLKVRRP